MRILVYVEHAEDQITGATAEILTMARNFADANKGTVEALIASSSPKSVTDTLSGVDVILRATHPSLANYTQTGHARALEAAIVQRSPDLVLFGYTSCGLDLAPYVATKHNFAMASYCVGLRKTGSQLQADCQMYGGKLMAEVLLPTPAVVAVTPGSYREKKLEVRKVEFVDLDVAASLTQLPVRFLAASGVDPSAIDITQIDKLLCVGRGIGEKDNVEAARNLATAMGAELVASRPLVDMGWLPKERQVGKSGRKVKPRLYMSLGVSGAPEHIEGMSASDIIIAVNTDAKAPIFQFAHYGAVVDSMELVIALQQALEKRGA